MNSHYCIPERQTNEKKIMYRKNTDFFFMCRINTYAYNEMQENTKLFFLSFQHQRALNKTELGSNSKIHSCFLQRFRCIRSIRRHVYQYKQMTLSLQSSHAHVPDLSSISISYFIRVKLNKDI